MASYGFVLVLFPVRNSMKKSERGKITISLTLALSFVFTLYLMLSLAASSYFGTQNIMTNIFDNFAKESDLVSKVILYLFLVIFLCNIPFVFFAGKIALIAMIETVLTLKAGRNTVKNVGIVKMDGTYSCPAALE